MLSQPPLRAPVLAQHTLGYLFSAKPQDRAGYFKALLEVTDLDEFRNAVAPLEKDSEVIPGPLIVKLEAAIEVAGKHLRPLLAKVPDAAALDAAFAAACKDLIEAPATPHPRSTRRGSRRSKQSSRRRERRRSRSRALIASLFPHGRKRPDELHEELARYLMERSKVDEEARHLTNLFSEGALAACRYRCDGQHRLPAMRHGGKA